MTDPVWNDIETSLRQLYMLPHNIIWIADKLSSTPNAKVAKKLQEIKSGISGAPRKEEFVGRELFFRVVGSSSRAYYSGEWWFDASILECIEEGYSRIFFDDGEMKSALRNMLREVLAISTEWNSIDEVWALELPMGERLTGYSSIVAPQRLFGSIPLTAKGSRLLVGRARQIFFPVKNPLWVKRYRDLV